MIFDLKGCTAVVTGAAGAIGQAIVRRLTDHGANVIASDFKAGDAIHQLDVTDELSWANLVETVQGQVQHIDILVNCAGIAPMGKIEDFALTEWRAAMAVNVEGVALGIKAFLPLLRAAQDVARAAHRSSTLRRPHPGDPRP